jgi:hypothetical protein
MNNLIYWSGSETRLQKDQQLLISHKSKLTKIQSQEYMPSEGTCYRNLDVGSTHES